MGRLPIVGDDPRNPDRRNIFSAAPIVRDGVLEGYLYIVLAGEQFVSAAGLLRGSYILKAGAWAVVGAILVTLIGALLLSRHLTRRLTDLNRDMTAFRALSLDNPQPPGTASDFPDMDEVDQLRCTFDAMAERIRDQIAELEDQDRLRREMVANVSHDLRTPLDPPPGLHRNRPAQGGELSRRKNGGSISRSLSATANDLGRLVTDLFELAKLEALNEPVERERLPIGELVQDVAQKFSLNARDRGVVPQRRARRRTNDDHGRCRSDGVRPRKRA